MAPPPVDLKPFARRLAMHMRARLRFGSFLPSKPGVFRSFHLGDCQLFSSWPGFVPAIHVFLADGVPKTWMPVTSTGMTAQLPKSLSLFRVRLKNVTKASTR